MKFLSFLSAAAALAGIGSATILQNGQVRETNYPDTKINPKDYDFKTYSPSASEISYKGRWDSKFISWWSAPGIKFGFTGNQVALTLGPETINTTLVAYRISGQDWQFTNVTAGATHLLVSKNTPAVDLTAPINPKTFELRVTNWEYGIQIAKVHVAKGEKLIKIPNFSRNIEFIGDSISQGYGATYEGLSSFAYALAAGFGKTEYSITAFSGICLQDKLCWGHERGLLYQWFRTSDVSGRAGALYGTKGEKAPKWDFKKQQPADIVIINAGTNDANTYNVPDPVAYVAQYKLLIGGIHAIWPKAQVILLTPVGGFGTDGNSWKQDPIFPSEILEVYKYFNTPAYLANPVLYDPVKNKTYTSNKASEPFVHHFDTKGIMQHNDYNPKWHPTDVGHIKLASHLMQYIKIKFGWELEATGPEVLSGTLYWNDEDRY